MNFITDDIRMLYRKLLIPSLTGAVVMSIYCITGINDDFFITSS